MDTADSSWHSFTKEEVLAKIQSSQKGLGSEEAAGRLAEYGANRLTPHKRRGPIARFLLQFHNVLIYVLLVAAGVTAFLGHWTDTSVILGVVLINAIIGFVQEGKAEHALEAIRTLLSPKAMVLRDEHRIVIDAADLVPGDIVILQSGDRVPADLRLIRQKNLRIDEALLTGESVPVEKSIEPQETSTVLADRRCMAWSGTFVTYGHGCGVVVATGDETELGRISGMLQEVEKLTTPLLRQQATFGRWLTIAILFLSAVTFLFGFYFRDYSATDMFLAAVGIAVAAIPEGLPAILTITLAIGVQRMARNRAIIRRLPAVETLGSVSVICTDKTGTLTRNEMMVTTLATAGGLIEVTGSGYQPSGSFTRDGEPVESIVDSTPDDAVRAAALCNDAVIEQKDGEWKLRGDPTEGALMVLAMKAGLEPALEKEHIPRLDVIPFESENRFMATLHHDHNGHHFVYLKGAPEKILHFCKSERRDGDDQPLDQAFWKEQIEHIANNGERTLAVAFKSMPEARHDLSFSDIEDGFTLLGVYGITDPPRQEAIDSIAQCHAAGIRVIMITGDHAATARAIGVQLGIGDGKEVLEGGDIDNMDDDQLAERLKSTDVIARASPEHKLRLVGILQKEGLIVAMTGDGVNDAPALKRANIGIAMGHKGTEVAREASEMVLTDDNFASITRAVEEGRTVYDNLRKSILYILPTSAGEAFLLIVAILTGYVLPITPVHILWVNMVTTVTLALSLAFEPPEDAVMKRLPRDPGEPILSVYFTWRIVFVSAVVVAGCFGLFLWFEMQGVTVEYARTATVNTLVMFEVFYLFNTRYIDAPAFTFRGVFGNRYVLLAVLLVILFQLLFTYTSGMQQLFKTSSLQWGAWIPVLAVAFSIFVLVEIEKLVVRTLQH